MELDATEAEQGVHNRKRAHAEANDGSSSSRRKFEKGRVGFPEVSVEFDDVEAVSAQFSTDETGQSMESMDGYKAANGCWHTWDSLKHLPSRGIAAAPFVLDV